MTSTMPMTLQERNRLRNRSHIAQQALKIFLRDGFDQTTVETVARSAGVSRRTFFRYFASKEAAFFANQEELLEQFRALLDDEEGAGGPYGQVKRVCLRMAQVYVEEREVVLAQFRVTASSRTLVAYDQQLDSHWEELIYERLALHASDERQHQIARIQAGAILGAIRTTLRRWFEADAQGDLVEQGRLTFEILEQHPPGSPHPG